MPRWESNTQERLVQAALELYAEHGYDHTTVGEIAARVGVTPRTYFRYFPDKREVLFTSGKVIHEALVGSAREALQAASEPFQAVLAGVRASREVFLPREVVRARAAVVASSEELRERELMKAASISAELCVALVEAGCEAPIARMTAEAGLAVFTEATRRWQDGDDRPFDDLVDEAAELLRKATSL